MATLLYFFWTKSVFNRYPFGLRHFVDGIKGGRLTVCLRPEHPPRQLGNSRSDFGEFLPDRENLTPR
jgi:hypothetical protein